MTRYFNPPARSVHLQARSISGFGLVELMVAMVIGLVVVGAAFAIFMSNQNTFRANESLNRMQESARVAFELMSRDIRAAGGSACSSASVMESVGAMAEAYRDTPVTGSGSEISVLSGDDSAYRVTDSTPSSVTLDVAEVPDATDVFDVGDRLLLCNARKSFVVEATAVSSTTVSYAALPGGYDPTEDEFAPPSAVVLSRFRSVRWFVQSNGRGGNSLYVSRFGGAAEEVADGVTGLSFEYLTTGAGNYVASPADWRDVIAVRIGMTLQGNDVDGRALTRQASNVVSLRGRTL